MWGVVPSLLLAILCLCQAWRVHSKCVDLRDESGIITETYPGPRTQRYHKCWNILNPRNQLLEVNLKHLDLEKRHCNYVNLTLTIERTGERIKWCDSNIERKPISVYSSVILDFHVDSLELAENSHKNFELHYHIDSTTYGMEGVKEAHLQAILYLKNNWPSWKWSNNIPKAIAALALDEGPYFDDRNITDKHLLSQRELQLSFSLMRDQVRSSEQLATFINSVVSTCHNPRNFYGNNLVELLKHQMSSENYTHPSAYLALCNANETWPEKAHENLRSTFDSEFYIPFKTDYQAFAVMAISCRLRQTVDSVEEELLSYYEEAIKYFKSLQRTDGRFGNLRRTALIIQALVGSGHQQHTDWDALNAVRFLMKTMKVPPTDFLSTYLMLPLFREKTLVDIAFTNCPSLRGEVDLVAEILDYFVPKIRVQYSLFKGDARDVIQTISFKVPENSTAFEVMELAASKDKRYQFEYDSEFGKKVIYEMIGIPNEPEDGNFWLFYLKRSGSENEFTHFTIGPDETTLNDGDHIAMWYTKGHAPILRLE